MRTQEQRDEQTVVIGTALALFVATLIAAGGILWLADSVFNLGPGVINAVAAIALCGAGAVAIRHLRRSTNR